MLSALPRGRGRLWRRPAVVPRLPGLALREPPFLGTRSYAYSASPSGLQPRLDFAPAETPVAPDHHVRDSSEDLRGERLIESGQHPTTAQTLRRVAAALDHRLVVEFTDEIHGMQSTSANAADLVAVG
jgi:hypothetical protein